MIGGHYGEIYNICKNFSPEEKKLALMTIPTKMIEEELDRRGNIYTSMLSKLYDALDQINVETLDDAEEALKTLRSLLRADVSKD